MFHEGDLQSGIALAVQQSKAVLCFVHGHSQRSKDWEDILANDEEIHTAITQKAICLRLKVVSRETAFLASFCPVKTTPAIVVINNGSLQLDLQSPDLTTAQVKERLKASFLISTTNQNAPSSSTSIPPSQVQEASSPTPRADSPPSPSTEPQNVQAAQAAGNSASSNSAMQRVAAQNAQNIPPTTTRPPAAPPRNQQPPDTSTSDLQSQQRSDYVRMQKDREQKQRDERERIKQQIKSDREERRRLEQIRKQTEETAAAEKADASKPPKSNDIRVQVRMFDGSTQRQSFPPSSTISADVRSWIDSSVGQSSPYNLKIILTPLPNRNIEAAEEEQSLTDLGIKGSCTLVMVPVKGYVDSYADAAPGLVSSAVTGGYNLVTGTAGAVFGGVKSALGFGRATDPQQPRTEAASTENTEVPKARIRTLADQRAEAAKKDQQFYNGNQLNFQPRKDEDDGKND